MNVIQRGGRGQWRAAAGALCVALACGLAAVSVHAARGFQSSRAASPSDLYQQAVHQQDAVGNLESAIDLYRKVIAAKPDRALAARAQLRIAQCLEKLEKPDAAGAYEVVVRDYADQAASVTVARAWIDKHPPSPGQQASLRVERIWEGSDVNLEGEPSSDGRFLAFVDWGGKGANLAIRDLKTGQNKLLTHDATRGDWVENPVFSPDGRQIAYRFGEEDSTIRLINSDGTNMRVLVHDGHKNYLTGWSPDGNYIAVTHHNDDKTESIVLISAANGSTKQLKSTGSTGATLGGFSPDGRFLVYAMDKDPKNPATGNGGVFLLATDANRETPLLQGSEQGPTTFRAPLWSPDGSRVVFMSDRSGVPGFWSIRVANGRPDGAPEPVPIQANVISMNPLGFTRDGSFYYGTQDIEVEAYTAEFDPKALTAGKPVPITDRSVGNNRDPQLSPDGKSVAFIRRRVGVPWEVMIRSSETGAERPVNTINGSGAYGARTLEWFPDGRSVLVTDTVERRKRFRQINVESGEAQTVFEGPWEVWIGALSADGKALFYSIKEDGTLRLVKRRIDTKEETELYRRKEPPASDGTGFFGLAASPDGTQVTFSVNTAAGQVLMIVPTDGGTPREVYRYGSNAPGSMARGDAMAWTKDGRYIVFSGTCGPGVGQQLCAISTEGGEPRPLGVSMPEIMSRMISADGRHIAFTGRTQKHELWVIRNLLSEPAKAR